MFEQTDPDDESTSTSSQSTTTTTTTVTSTMASLATLNQEQYEQLRAELIAHFSSSGILPILPNSLGTATSNTTITTEAATIKKSTKRQRKKKKSSPSSRNQEKWDNFTTETNMFNAILSGTHSPQVKRTRKTITQTPEKNKMK